MLGENGTRILMAELQYRGGYSPDIQHDLSLEKIMHVSKNAFGEQVAQALIEEILLRMDEIYEVTSRRRTESVQTRGLNSSAAAPHASLQHTYQRNDP